MRIDDRPFSAYLDKMNVITILLPNTYHNGTSDRFFIIDGNNRILPLFITDVIPLWNETKYVCTTTSPPEIGEQFWIIDAHNRKTDLQIGSVIRTEEFDQLFYYDGNDLGVSYFPEKVKFKVWAPTATRVKVKLSSPNQQTICEHEMSRQQKGIWCYEAKGYFEYYIYSFLVCINQEWQEAVDPYAVAVTANGKQGVIIDLEKTRLPKEKLPPFKSPVDAIIYETHVRDFTIHPSSGIKNKGTFMGAAERNTAARDGMVTGLSYVKDMGFTHIEFLPFNDFDGVDEVGNKTDYNWGYNPLHFNVPEGSYSSDPNDPYARIRELKQLISTIHNEGIRVIMDVVYNHVFIREDSSFEKIVPGYYFRHDQHGMPSNGTGVGNDIATERLMVRKFIVDSVKFWMNEYHIDGFRFDLMGIIDIDTMLEIRNTVDDIDNTTILLGEGWDLNTPIPAEDKANIRNQKKLPQIAQFNDWFRDSIKGSTFNLYDRGYALGNDHYYDSARQVMFGSIGIERSSQGIFYEPTQTVNYVESHDNHTLWDKISICNQEADNITKQKRHRLATAMVLLAQGIPFLQSGQEFFRTKKGIGNSYRSPDDINWINWENRILYCDNVDFIKGIISIRKSHGAFRLASAALIRNHMSVLPIQKPVIGYCLKKVGEFGKWEWVICLFNPTPSSMLFTLPGEGDWFILVNGERASSLPLGKTENGQFTIKPISVSVLVK